VCILAFFNDASTKWFRTIGTSLFDSFFVKGASNANEQAHVVAGNSKRRYAGEDGRPLDSGSSWMILLTFNNGNHDMFVNWWTHYLLLNMQNTVTVIAEDELTFTYLNKLATSHKHLVVERSDLKSTRAHAYESKLYLAMVSTRARHILALLEKGEKVLYTDVDTVWREDPTPYLTNALDLQAQNDQMKMNLITEDGNRFSPYNSDGGRNYCTGFVAIVPNAKTKAFVKAWDVELSNKKQLNQLVFNQLLDIAGLIHAPLPMLKFPSGRLYFERLTPAQQDEVAVVHNNYIVGTYNKKKRFQDKDLWH
jgi:rhamnogalacturonan II specific xylosyltransferase